MVSVLLTALSAVLYGLAFPPTRWTPLAWVAVAPLLVALRDGGPLRSALLAWLWCVVGACVAGTWFPRAVSDYFGQSLVVSLLLFAFVFTVMAAPYFMVFALVYRALARRVERALPLLAGAAWVGAELGRGRLLTGTPIFIGNPWGLAGYAHAEALPLVQIAAVTGIYGVSFVVACANAAVAELWFQRRAPRRALQSAAWALVPLLVALVYGHASLRGGPAGEAGTLATRVAIVQGNLALGSRWRSDLYGRNLDVYLRLTWEAAASDPPAVVFWPEAAMTFFLEDEPLYQRAIARVLQQADVELVAGGPRNDGSDPPRYTNSIYAIAPDGSIRGRYDKQYLVPFAEYFPLQIDVLRRRFGRVRVFEHGRTTGPLPTRAGPAGVVICNESMLPEVVAARVAEGAAYLLNPSNDTWIADPQYTWQQFDIARMRAIEQRRYLVRASTAGPSALVDPWGRVRARSDAGARELVVGEIRALHERSVYGRVGDAFALLCVAAVIGVLVGRRPAPAPVRAPTR